MNLPCPCQTTSKTILHDPVQGRYCPLCGQFDEARFLEHWHAVYFVVFSFIHRFMRRNLAATGLDYLSNKIASEIWIHNLGQLLANGSYPQLAGQLVHDETRSQVLKKCNTHSIALYLGIPQETARRKVAALIEKGWVVKDAEGSLMISAACEEEFKPEFNLETMRDFVSSARAVMAMLGIEAAPKPDDPER